MGINAFIEQNYGIILLVMGVYVIVMTFILIFNDRTNKQTKVKKEEKEKTKDLSKLYPLYSIRGILDYLKRKFFPSNIMIANMELLTGFHKTLLVKNKGGFFEYDKKTYIIDDALKYWNADCKMYCSDYHENISMPIARKIDANSIKEFAERLNGGGIKYAYNPKTLHQFLAGDVAEGVIKSGELSEFMRQLRLIIIIIGVIVLIHLLLYAQKSGVFKSVQSIV